MTLGDKLREDYAVVFKQQWPVWVGGLSIGFLNVFLFIFYQPWTTLDGVLNWGDWTLGGLGIIEAQALSPLLRSGSVINFGLLFGSLFAALLAGQFGIRIGPNRELIKGAIGGLLIGTGAVLARGCNIGGFFSGSSAMGMHGLTMAVGLAIGAFIGARYIVWEMENVSSPPPSTQSKRFRPLLANPKVQPWVGLVILIGLLAGAAAYLLSGYVDRAFILLAGAVLGVVSQRSRVCFVRGFREPFLTGETSHTKAMLLGLLVSVIGFAIVKYVIFDKVDEFVRPTFWLGSLVGGVIFGIGMVLAGGCGGGTIWRVGEGHVKLWVALVGYILSASLVNEWLQNSGLISQLGEAVFLPDVVGGWTWAIVIMFSVIIIWYLLVEENEASGRMAAI